MHIVTDKGASGEERKFDSHSVHTASGKRPLLPH